MSRHGLDAPPRRTKLSRVGHHANEGTPDQSRIRTGPARVRRQEHRMNQSQILNSSQPCEVP